MEKTVTPEFLNNLASLAVAAALADWPVLQV